MISRTDISDFSAGAKCALPIFLGYLPLGFACGVLACGVGMTPFQSGIMSFLVFAGAGQYIAVAMIGASMPPLSIIFTVFIVNLRHLLYTSSLYPYVTDMTFLRKAIFASQITDETFALQSSLLSSSPKSYSHTLGVNITSHLGWIGGNVAGALLGSLFENAENFGLDFALPALFIALLVPHLSNMPKVFAALTAGILSLVFSVIGYDVLMIFAAIIGAGVGVLMSGDKKNA